MGVSIRPSEFVEGGAVPVDRNLIWKECRFANFDYTKKDGTVVASTVSAKIVYLDDEGTEYRVGRVIVNDTELAGGSQIGRFREISEIKP